MTPHSLYLAGPMTGIPQFNFPAFDAAAAELRDQGYEIVSPAELDDPETREAALASPDGAPGSGSADGETYGTFLSRDVKLVIDDVDGVVCLPDWHKSRGARIEVFTAATMGKPVFYFNPTDDVNLGAPYRFSELEGQLKPADPGGGDQHSRSVGPPVEPYEATREPGHTPAELRFRNAVADALAKVAIACDEPEQILVNAKAPQDQGELFGLPVIVRSDVPEDEVAIYGATATHRVKIGEHHAVLATPDGEERITDPETGGAKGRKDVRMDLIPWEPVWELARVYGKGDEKYPPDESGPNYLKGFDWSLSYGAALRHLTQWASGQDHDEEFGTHHLAHVAWHCFALMLFQWHDRGTDDRLTTLTGLTPVDPAQRTGRSEAARTEED